MAPKGSHTKTTDPPSDTLAVNGVTTPPDASAVNQSNGNTTGEVTLADNGNVASNGQVADNGVSAGSSGLSVADKAVIVDEDGFIDNSDDEMELDLALEAESRLRTAIVLLIPFALKKEFACIVDTVRMLIKHGWNAELSAEASTTSTKFQELPTIYITKERYSGLQISFLNESDAETVKRKDVLYKQLKGNLVKLHWQHTEDAAYGREKALNPSAIEVVIKGVSAIVELYILTRRLSVY
ncbi:unnamed protein product [Closterium sp. NIES-53]